MSVIAMRKLTLVGLKSERDRLLSGFSRIKCVHMTDVKDIQTVEKAEDFVKVQTLEEKMSSVDFAMRFIADCVENKRAIQKKSGEKRDEPLKTGGGRVEMDYDLFVSSERDEFKLFGGVVDLCSVYKNRLNEIENEITRSRALAAQLSVYLDVDARLDEFKDTANAAMFLGTVNPSLFKEIEELGQRFDESFIELLAGNTVMFAVCLKENKADFQGELNKLGYQRCNLDYDVDSKEKLQETEALIKRLQDERNDIYNKAAELREHMPRLKVLYDYYSINIQKARADEDMVFTSQAYVLSAWYPVEDEAKVMGTVDKYTTAAVVETEEPVEDRDLPPTKLKSNAFSGPFSFVTNMFSVPNYWEQDPNMFVGVWFTFLFGMMLGDVGYGLLLALLGLIAIRVLKPEGGMRNLIAILAYGGISTMFWGVMFGGWFSIEYFSERPILLSPLENPIEMMGLSIGLGILHMSTGFILSGVAKIRKGKWLDAILDDFIWIFTYVGIALFLLSYFGGVEGVIEPGMYLLVGSLAVVLFTRGRHKKGFFGKVIGGFGGLYNVINLMSDALSYLRLFGLGLAAGIVGWVFNLLAQMLMTSWVGTIMGVLIIIVGHVLNLAINVLGTFIHDMRLQHVEFFGKFYSGEGIPFKEFANDTKYVRLK